MSGLLAALQRLEGRDHGASPIAATTAPAAPAERPRIERAPVEAPPATTTPEPFVVPQPKEVAITTKPATRESRDAEWFGPFVDALTADCPPPALVAFLTVGVEGSITPLLRDHADAVARRLGRDVVLLGPGILDEAASATSGWNALRHRAAYGFLHASAEFALARPSALQQVSAVVPVVELKKSSTHSLQELRRVLAVHRIAVLGAVVVSD